MKKAIIFILLFIVHVLMDNEVKAHDLGISTLKIERLDSGHFRYEWRANKRLTLPNGKLKLGLPAQCLQFPSQIHCQGRMKILDVSIEALPPHAEVLLTYQEGRHTSTHILNHWQSSAALDFNSDQQGTLNYLLIGVEHIIFGIDHLLFLVGLLFIVTEKIALIKTITAFTIGHSLTLALALYDVLAISSQFVEVMIALSILHLAIEITIPRKTLTRRLPWLIAGLFGLVHGLGFAGSIAEIGLPEEAFLWSLFLFNLGVELGQVAFVLVVIALRWSVERGNLTRFAPTSIYLARQVCVVGLGASSVYWILSRLQLDA